MGLIIAGDRSGSGKTTITLALLAFLVKKGYSVQSFKVGPDYIDPMFHTAITARPCRNLDPILTSESSVKACFATHTQGVNYAVIEGVMGLFDGVNSPEASDNLNDYASTAHIARLLALPVALVIDCRGLSTSVAAIAQGYRSFDPQVKIIGVILNKVGSDRHLELLTQALEAINLPILGVFRRQDAITIPHRHLGLVPSEELAQLSEIMNHLAHLAQTAFKWESIFPLLTPSTAYSPTLLPPLPPIPTVRIAVARDRAFNFYYEDNFDILRQLGAELVFFSPLHDQSLPEAIAGLYFGGGFPEVFAHALAENQPIKANIRKMIRLGIPTYAECGGLMYLSEKIIDFEQKSWKMLKMLPTQAVMEKRLILGYRRAKVLENSPFLKAGKTLRGHEFHRSQLISSPLKPLFSLQGLGKQGEAIQEGWKSTNIHASYLHLHFKGSLGLAKTFIDSCLDFSQKVR